MRFRIEDVHAPAPRQCKTADPTTIQAVFELSTGQTRTTTLTTTPSGGETAALTSAALLGIPVIQGVGQYQEQLTLALRDQLRLRFEGDARVERDLGR